MRHNRALLVLSVLTAVLAAPRLVPADDLPPLDAKPFTGVYHSERRYRLPPDDPEWKTVTDDVTIKMSGLQSRWDYKNGRTTIYDYGNRTLTEFGGTVPANSANRLHFTSIPMPIGWEFGFGKAARVEGAKPQAVGTATVAGQQCTRVMVESEVYGKPEFCVTPGGTVLRYEIKELNDSIVYEAQSVTVGAPEASVFEVPQGYATNDKALSNPGSRSITFGRPGGTSPNAP